MGKRDFRNTARDTGGAEMVEDPNISLEAYQDSWRDTIDRAFADWRMRDPLTWAKEVRRRRGEFGGSESMDFERFPYQRDMLLALFDPANSEVVFKLASRLGKTDVCLNKIGYHIHEDPKRIIVMWPTVEGAEKWSKDELMEQLVAPTPELDAIIGDGMGQRLKSQTILSKAYPGGLITALGSNVPSALRRAKGTVLYAEEIDSIKAGMNDEGDPLEQLKTRGREYPDVIEIYASYPSIKGRSRISDKYDASDRRKWMVHCGYCRNDAWAFNRERDLRFEKEAPEKARLHCPECGNPHDDSARYQMMLKGRWLATAPFKGIAGFHASSLLWPHKTPPRFPGGYLQMIAEQMLAIETSSNPEQSRIVITTTCDAEAYEAKVDVKADHSDLYKGREDYDPRVLLPDGVLILTAGVDVQADRLEVEVVGHGLDEQAWGIDYVVLGGDPLTPEPWEKLDKLLGRFQRKHPRYGYMGIYGMAVDCSYRPDEVLAWTRPRLRRRVYAVAGSPHLGRPYTGKARRQGNPPALVFELGSNEAKDILYQRLQLQRPEGSDPFPHGFQHFPKLACYDEDYFKQLTAEDSRLEQGPGGTYFRVFTKPNGVRNEALDCRYYALAVPRLTRVSLSRTYKRLEMAAAVKDCTAAGGGEVQTPEAPTGHARPKKKRRVVKSFGGWSRFGG